jgi:transposase, IS5 family
MKQGSLSELCFVRRKKPMRREIFLEEMEVSVPWVRFEALIRPHYPAGGNGRRPYPLSAMLRIHFLLLHITPALLCRLKKIPKI